MAIIKGYLKDAASTPIPDAAIILKALNNSNSVLIGTRTIITTAKNGYYEINVLAGEYEALLQVAGHTSITVGVIRVLPDSVSGTLNDFLLDNRNTDEVTPTLLLQLQEQRSLAEQAAEKAKLSADNAINALDNAVKKNGDTMTKTLVIEDSNALRLKNLSKNISALLRFDGNDFWVLFSYPDVPDGSYSDLRPFKINSLTGDVDFGHNVSIRGKKLIAQGDFGLGSTGAAFTNNNFDDISVDGSGFYNLGENSNGTFPANFSKLCSIINISRSLAKDKKCSQIIIDTISDRIALRTANASNFKPWVEFITTANSTTDSNGFLKKASPILRLFGNKKIEEMDGFTKSGCALINSEAAGVTAKRIDVGHYEIHGSLGFAKEGWYITLPEDANGNKKCFAEYSINKKNVITVKTFTRKFDFEKCEVVAGEPIDITEGRWIDIRLEMPEKQQEVSEVNNDIEQIPSTLNPVE